MNGEVESKFHDRIKDLFGASWGNFVLGAVGALLSVWMIVGGLAAADAHTTMLGPVTWWLQQITDLGFTPPAWLTNFTAWRPQQSADVVGWVLVVSAAALATRRNPAPGFFLCAWLLLVASCEWFGVQSTVVRFGLLSLVPIVVAVALAAYQHRGSPSSSPRFMFSADSIMAGFFAGPAAVVFLPVLMPVGLAASVVQSYGFPDRSTEDTTAVQVLEATLQAVAQHGGTLNDLPAATHARLLTAIHLAGADERSRKEAAAMLRYRSPARAAARRLHAAPTGAVPLLR